MTFKKLKAAKMEALRFADKCHEAMVRMDKNKSLAYSKETGAVRRASMDLTRTLAELRRTNENNPSQ